MPNFTVNFPRESEVSFKVIIYVYVMIPTFKIKFKHVYLCNVDQGLVIFYQQNFRPRTRDLRSIIRFFYNFISQKIFYWIRYKVPNYRCNNSVYTYSIFPVI